MADQEKEEQQKGYGDVLDDQVGVIGQNIGEAASNLGHILGQSIAKKLSEFGHRYEEEHLQKP
jgi:hypothetical protein